MRPNPLLFVILAPAIAWGAGDPEEGRKLVAEHRCEGCHDARTQGSRGAIYLRKDHKVTSPEKLRTQIARCNSELNLQLFPDDEEHIAAFLDRMYYRFQAK